MKNLLLISALGLLIVGCDPAPTVSATTADVAPATGAENGPGNATAENASTTTETENANIAATASVQDTPPAPPAVSSNGTTTPKAGDEVAVMETAQGRIVLMFLPDKAPKHVASFKKLANAKFYDNTAFHRVIPGFMIQGGDPNSDPKRAAGPAGTGGPGFTVKAEFNDVKHVRGILSAARSQDPDSAGSQFFICVATAESLDGQYTAYGRVVSGMEVADKIVALDRNSMDMPTTIDQARVKSVRIAKWPVK